MAENKGKARDVNATGAGMGTNPLGRMAPLGDLNNFEVAKDIRDPRGWDVLTADGSKIGKVHELIVDTGALRTRYIDISLDKKALRLNQERDVLIPVGDARLDTSDEKVVIEGLTVTQLADLPEFNHVEITREYEASVLPTFRGAGQMKAGEGIDFYADRHFDDTRFYGAANRATGPTITETGAR